MKISINWIKDFVDLSGIDTKDLISRFNLSTAEIEEVINMGENTKGVVVAKILKVEKHPESTKLHILSVDAGGDLPVQIVCGASNVRQGMLTALAQVGSVVNGLKISKAKLAGTESFGMCLSEVELGIGSDNSGIMDLDDTLKVGTDIKDVFPIDDIVFEVDNKSLTNRPDLWSHYGIAREFAAIFDRQLKSLDLVDLEQFNKLPAVDVYVESANCYRYSCLTVKNIKQNKTPMQIKIRLNYCDLRDINLLADMTNYVMLEVGQPMHAFDNAVVNGINVLDAKKDTPLTTLENEERVLPKGAMMICDSKSQPVAIAGIKGGLNSGITNQTNSLLLESANFDCVAIRKTSKAVNLGTDSSIRYEKCLDPELTKVSIQRLLGLLQSIDKGVEVTSRFTDVYNYVYPTKTINISYDFLRLRSGVNLSEELIDKILTSLQFEFTKNNGELSVTVPSFRATKDVSIKEDLLEEVLRMYGYDNIVPQSMSFDLQPVNRSKEQLCEFETKKLLAEKYSVSEVHSHLWNYAEFNKTHNIEHKSFVSLLDSSNSGQSGIRSMLSPTMLKFINENRNNFADIKICEIGKVANDLKDGLAVESQRLSIAIASTTMSQKNLYFEIKAMIDNICQTVVNTSVEISFDKVPNFMHPVNSNTITINGVVCGFMGLIHPLTQNTLAPKHNVACLEIDFAALCNAPENEWQKLEVSKYQSVDLDFTFAVPTDVMYLELQNIIKSFQTKLQVSYSLKDIYRPDEQSQFASYTFKFVIGSLTRTLEGKDIEKFHSGLIAHFENNNIKLAM